MLLVDTSVWVDLFRDKTGKRRITLRKAIDGDDVVLCRFTQLELLQGSRDEKEWALLISYLEGQDYLEASETAYGAAARIYFDLRRQGLTVRSPIGCLIAQLAIEHDATLVHRDRDFEAIARVRPLSQLRLEW